MSDRYCLFVFFFQIHSLPARNAVNDVHVKHKNNDNIEEVGQTRFVKPEITMYRCRRSLFYAGRAFRNNNRARARVFLGAPVPFQSDDLALRRGRRTAARRRLSAVVENAKGSVRFAAASNNRLPRVSLRANENVFDLYRVCSAGRTAGRPNAIENPFVIGISGRDFECYPSSTSTVV